MPSPVPRIDAAAGSALIPAEPGRRSPGGSLVHLAAGGLLVVLTLATFWPTVHNGFLVAQFDDAIITETAALRDLSWESSVRLFTEFNQAHYVPLTLLTLALNHAVGGFDPYGYHLGNILLHALAALLAYAFLAPILPSRRAALLAAALFAVHPVQLESVTLAIQRKTVLSGAFFFLTLVLYQRWTFARRPAIYAASLFAFVAAALAKPSAMPLPLVLVLYDVCFVGRPLRWKDKIPFVAIAAAAGLAAQLAHAQVGASYGPYGGSWLTHFPVIGRVLLEYPVALVLPVDLAPMYYYSSAELVNAPGSFAALALILAALGYVAASARRRPWLFFCAGWFVLLLAPESNLIPISYLRTDRFLYLPMLGFCVAAALLWETGMNSSGRRERIVLTGVAVLAVVACASRTRQSIPIWKNEVTAWGRVVERTPTIAMPHFRLAAAQAAAGDLRAAERSYRRAAELRPDWADPHFALAKLYADHGLTAPARAAAERFAQLAPGDPRARALERVLTPRP